MRTGDPTALLGRELFVTVTLRADASQLPTARASTIAPRNGAAAE